MTSIDYARDDQGIVTLTMDMPGQAVNTMTQAFRDAYGRAVERIEQERETIIGVILTSNKPTFFVGGDLKGLLAAEDAAAPCYRAEATKALMRRLEKLGKPVVATINGAALGGGFELGLACHARFAINDGGAPARSSRDQSWAHSGCRRYRAPGPHAGARGCDAARPRRRRLWSGARR